MLADIKRNTRYLQQFKKYGLDLFKHMYSYNHIDIKRDKFRLIPVEPTQVASNINIHIATPTQQILDNSTMVYTYKFKGLSYNKYQYYLISVIDFYGHTYSTITNKIYRKPITLNHSLYNIQKSYMLVIPKANTPIESKSVDTGISFLMKPTNIRLCELNGGQIDTITKSLLILTCVDKSGYNVSIRRYHLLKRLRVYKREKRYKK